MCLSRCALVVAVAVRAVEAMFGFWVHDNFHVIVCVETFGDFLHGFQRNVAVLFTEVHQQRHFNVIGAVQVILDAAAVVGDGHIHQPVGGGEVREQPPKQ